MNRHFLAAYRTVIPIGVMAILTIQMVVGFVNTGRWGWPFLAYPMYRHAHDDGARLLHHTTIYAELENGSQQEITEADAGAGVEQWSYYYWAVKPLASGETEHIRPFMEEMCQRFDGKVTALRLDDESGYGISRNGLVEDLPNYTVNRMPASCD